MVGVVPERLVELAHRQRMGKKFEVGDRVRFHSTSSKELDGFGGSVLGQSIDDIVSHYIVLLDRPLARGDKAVSMPEVCLEYDELELVAHA